jgi:isopentenyl-diphosphate Delta-isomerase
MDNKQVILIDENDSYCCHPQPEENLNESAYNRLYEEMGLYCILKNVFQFVYKAKLENELTEYELDHVYIGYSDENPRINIHEASEWKYVSISELQQNIKMNPDDYTTWFKMIFAKVREYV